MRSLALALLALAGCGEAGRVSVSFSWGPGGPPPPPAMLLARVAEVDDAQAAVSVASARTLGAAAPVPVAAAIDLLIPDVPNGDDRVVIAEVRESASATSQLLRYGVSPRFSLSADIDEAVAVRVELSRPPESRGAIAIVGTSTVDGTTRSATVTLRVATDTGVRAEVSGFEAFPASGTRCFGLGRELEGCAPARACDGRWCIDWDLNFGLADDCGAAPARGSEARDRCPRRVFVRFYDAIGFASSPVAADVILDTLPPALQASDVSYTPSADSPLPRVTAARPGTTASLTIVAREPIRSPPPTIDARGPTTLTLTRVEGSQSALGVVYSVVIPAGAPDGDYLPTIALADLAGNAASVTAAPISVLGSTPALSVLQDRVSYLRSPIGTSRDEDLGGAFTIPAGPYFALGPSDPREAVDRLAAEVLAFEDGRALTLLRFWADADRRELLSAARPSEDGSWARAALALPPRDAARLFVTAIDRAGNESAPVPIEESWFVAPSGVSPSGRAQELRASPGSNAPLEPSAAISTRANVGAPDGSYLERSAERTWISARAGAPLARYVPQMVYDSARDRVVLFGGISVYVYAVENYQQYVDVWEWDGREWRDATPAGEGPRGYGKIAYDAARGETVLVENGNTWAWDGTRWTLKSTGAPVGNVMGLGYDAARRELILLRAVENAMGTILNTWAWDGARWTLRATGSTPRVYSGVMLYDDVRERLELIGPAPPDATLSVWSWDGSAWAEIPPLGDAPAAVVFTAYADVARGRRVLAGAASIDAQGDITAAGTHEWTGERWVSVPAADGPLYGGGAAYDRLRARPVLFGGRTIPAYDPSIPPVPQTWTREGDAWRELTSLASPPARRDQAMTYDEAHARVLLYGGASERDPLDDLWSWDGLRWSQVEASSPTPGPRANHALVYDAGRSRAVLFGGSETWELDGARWTRTSSAMPAGYIERSGAALAYDARRGRVVLFGGRSSTVAADHLPVPLGDTWEYDGESWSRASPPDPQPAARFGHAMVYDPTRAAVVMLGGSGVFVGTVERTFTLFGFDGARWSELSTSSPRPASRRSMALAFDPVRSSLLSFGGYQNLDGHGGFADGWELIAGAWTDVTPSRAGPSPSGTPTFAYDRARDELVLFTSANTFGAPSETWILSRPERPTVQLAAAMPDDTTASTLTELAVRASCGGTGALPGAELLAWNVRRQGWDPLASHGEAEPALLEPRMLTAADYLGPGRKVYVQCRPTGASGLGFARVRADYLEVRARFRTR